MTSDLEGQRASGLDILRHWDPTWAAACSAMNGYPGRTGFLDGRFLQLVCVGLRASCTALDGTATRRHIRAALAAGATRDELVFGIKCATVVAVHSLSVAAPILVQELEDAGALKASEREPATPFCDALRAEGRWNVAWDPFLRLDPGWTERFMAMGSAIYTTELFSPKKIELLSIALDASVTHLYAPGLRRHIRGASAAGATSGEILAVLELCVGYGVQSVDLAIPILDDELSRSL